MHIIFLGIATVLIIGALKLAVVTFGEYQLSWLMFSGLYFGIWMISRWSLGNTGFEQEVRINTSKRKIFGRLFQVVGSASLYFVLFIYVGILTLSNFFLLLFDGHPVYAFAIVSVSAFPLTILAYCADSHNESRKH